MDQRAPKYQIRINGRNLNELAPVANSCIRNITFEEAFSRTSHVDITFEDAVGFDLLISQINPLDNPVLELSMGYHNCLPKVFEGTIVEVNPSGDQGDNPKLILKAYDYSTALKSPRDPVTYTDTNLYKIVYDIIMNIKNPILNPIIVPGNRMKNVASDEIIQSITQMTATDWELLAGAAEFVNLKLFCRGKDVYLVDSDYLAQNQLNPGRKYIYKPGINEVDKETSFPIVSVNPKIAREGQRLKVEVRGWVSYDSEGFKRGTMDLDGLKNKYKNYSELIVSSTSLETIVIKGKSIKNSNDAKRYAEEELRKRADRLVRGDAVIVGDPFVRMGDKFNVTMRIFGDIGSKFSGGYTVSGVRHTLSDNGFLTELDIERNMLTDA